MGTEKETSSHGRSPLSPLALLGILAFGSILIHKMSKKWKKPGATQERTHADPKPTEHCHFDPAALHAVYVQQATENKKWNAVQKIFFRKQLSKATCLNILTAVTAAVAFGYGFVNFLMWTEMKHANTLAQKTFEVSQQASVTLGNKDGVVAQLRRGANPKLEDGMVIYFQNSGHMPAKLTWGIDEWFVMGNPPVMLPGTTKFEPMRRTRNKKTGAITETASTDGSIGGEAVREVAVGSLPAGFVDYLAKTNKVFKVNGTYEYCDELGRYACRDFSLVVQRSPFGTFRIMWDKACVARRFLGDIKAAPDEELLPPCVPRNAPGYPDPEQKY